MLIVVKPQNPIQKILINQNTLVKEQMLLLILLNVCNSQDAKNTYNYESQRSIVIDVNFDDFLSCFDLNDTGDIALQTHIPLPPRNRKHHHIPPPPPPPPPITRLHKGLLHPGLAESPRRPRREAPKPLRRVEERGSS